MGNLVRTEGSTCYTQLCSLGLPTDTVPQAQSLLRVLVLGGMVSSTSKAQLWFKAPLLPYVSIIVCQ